jgi:putative radical SAM enzyme (TIGR03279 family)
MKIGVVKEGSPAFLAGLRPGDDLLSVNGERVRDFLDLYVYLNEDLLDLEVRRAGADRAFRIVREYGRELGIEVEEPPPKVCANKCPFCFVDQNPGGLRRTLYVRDEDYRFSFLHGNYTTLTSLRPWEMERIVEQRLSPLYVSVHALDPEVRYRLLLSKRADEIEATLAYFAGHGIDMHTQVVVCPGINDGRVLEETIEGLAKLRPHVLSVSVVPVGLTKHRNPEDGIRLVTRAEAGVTAAEVLAWGKAFRKRSGEGFVYLADEYVLLAGIPVPPAAYYDGFPQLENGVGMLRSTIDDVAARAVDGPALREAGLRKVVIATGRSAAPTLASLFAAEARGMRAPAPEITVLPVANRLFGESVTVAGLLAGKDLLDALDAHGPSDATLVPPAALNRDRVFLDDLPWEEFVRRRGGLVHAGFEPLWDPRPWHAAIPS